MSLPTPSTSSAPLVNIHPKFLLTREHWEGIRRHGLYQLSWMEISKLIEEVTLENPVRPLLQKAAAELKKTLKLDPNESITSPFRSAGFSVPLKGALNEDSLKRFIKAPDIDQKQKTQQRLVQHFLAWQRLFANDLSGRIYDPKLNFSQIMANTSSTMPETNAVAPITYRQMVHLFVNDLPPLTREQVGLFLKNSGETERKRNGTEQPYQQQIEQFLIDHLPGDGLDRSIQGPIFQINLHASERLILKDLTAVVKKLKKQLGLGSEKKHTQRLDDYHSVWDEREGFADGQYQMENARKFKEISARRKLPLPTICSHYCSAFQLIVGKPFSPELWWETFGQLKFRSLINQGVQTSRNNARHNFKKPTRRPVPVSKLVLSQDSNDALPHLDSRNNDIASKVDQFLESDFRIDLEDLIKKGLTNVEIAKARDCPVEVVAAFREQHEELLSISAKSGRKKG